MAEKVRPTADVAVSVLTYHRPETTRLFFKELWERTASTRFDLFVVDNGSGEETLSVLMELPTETPVGGSVHLVLMNENIGWCPAKNVGLALAQGRYEHLALMENDCTCRLLDRSFGEDWLGAHVNMIDSLGLRVVQGRHAPKQHKDEGLYWRVRKEGRRWWPADPHDTLTFQYRSSNWPLRMHDELLTRMLVMQTDVIDEVGAFNEEVFPANLGMFADVEWSDRVLRRYQQEQGIVWGVSLDERVFEFLEINPDTCGIDETYPDEEKAHEVGKMVHAQAFQERRIYIVDHPEPDLHVPFSESVAANVQAFWEREVG